MHICHSTKRRIGYISEWVYHCCRPPIRIIPYLPQKYHTRFCTNISYFVSILCEVVLLVFDGFIGI